MCGPRVGVWGPLAPADDQPRSSDRLRDAMAASADMVGGQPNPTTVAVECDALAASPLQSPRPAPACNDPEGSSARSSGTAANASGMVKELTAGDATDNASGKDNVPEATANQTGGLETIGTQPITPSPVSKPQATARPRKKGLRQPTLNN